MGNLVLDSLEIQNFRAFQHLRIEKLGRVNLITGKNSVGKTSLLEALWLYARGGSPYQLLASLNARDELPTPNWDHPNIEITIQEERLSRNIKHLFFGRAKIEDHPAAIRIGPVNSPENSLSIEVQFMPFSSKESHDTVISTPHIVTKTRTQVYYDYSIDDLLSRKFNPYLTSPDMIVSPFLGVNGLDRSSISQMWDQIALTTQEEEVISALRIINDKIQQIGFIGVGGNEQRRIPIVRVMGVAEPIPLRSFGEGTNWLFGMALALVNARDGILLVDEIVNGLHYSVQTDVWRLIFRVAHRLNVQVFATTHSWDCIQAFQTAACENKEEEGELIRLVNWKGYITPVLFDEKELEVVTDQQIEVR